MKEISKISVVTKKGNKKVATQLMAVYYSSCGVAAMTPFTTIEAAREWAAKIEQNYCG